MNPADTFQALTELARLARGLPAECVITSASVGGIHGSAIFATHEDPAGVHRSLGATEASAQASGCIVATYVDINLFVSPPYVDSRSVKL